MDWYLLGGLLCTHVLCFLAGAWCGLDKAQKILEQLKKEYDNRNK